MKIKSAHFVISNTEVAKCPQTTLPEYAFIGRSNVGKSSLINALCNKKNLAKTSSRPGKTQLINHFLINENWHLVDLPGYGYARVSKSDKKVFQHYITSYFLKRKQLISAFLLIDIRHDPQPIDLNFTQWLGTHEIPFGIVFTKADKLKPLALEKRVDSYCEKLLEQWETLPPRFITSAQSKQGTDDLLAYIDSLNKRIKSQFKS